MYFFLLALQPPLGVVFYNPLVGFSLLAYEVSWLHTTTRHIRQDSSERMISPSQRPLPDNTQHSQQTNIHAPGGIRTHNLSRLATKDLRLRPRGHWDRLSLWLEHRIVQIKTNYMGVKDMLMLVSVWRMKNDKFIHVRVFDIFCWVKTQNFVDQDQLHFY